MVDVKEIRKIKIVPFTLMSSSISAILAFIGAIIFAISVGIISALLPPELAPLGSALAGFGITAIIAYPILTFLVGLSTVFLSVMIYNLLVPRIGGVKLGMDGNNVASIPIVPFALILSIIMAIWAFIIGLLITTALAPITGLIGSSIPLVANMTNVTATGEGFGALVAFGAVFFIIILPIVVFIVGFIVHALYAIFYNYITTRVSRIQLNFTAFRDRWNELTSIPVVPAALAIAITYTILQLISGIINLISAAAAGEAGAGVVTFLTNVIGGFIYAFIAVALIAVFYNFLAPRIGTIKLAFE
jgi:hypothetical protein